MERFRSRCNCATSVPFFLCELLLFPQSCFRFICCSTLLPIHSGGAFLCTYMRSLSVSYHLSLSLTRCASSLSLSLETNGGEIHKSSIEKKRIKYDRARERWSRPALHSLRARRLPPVCAPHTIDDVGCRCHLLTPSYPLIVRIVAL